MFDPETFQIGRDLLPLTNTDHIGLYGPERSIIDRSVSVTAKGQN